jgi:hypothetical protein
VAHARTSIVATFVLLAGRAEADGPPERPVLRPVKGTIRLDGKPLAGAVVAFIPTGEGGPPSSPKSATTGPTSPPTSARRGCGGPLPGRRQLQGHRRRQDRRRRNAVGPEVASSRELLPEKYSDMGRSVLKADVEESRGTFDYDLQGLLLAPPAPAANPPGE